MRICLSHDWITEVNTLLFCEQLNSFKKSILLCCTTNEKVTSVTRKYCHSNAHIYFQTIHKSKMIQVLKVSIDMWWQLIDVAICCWIGLIHVYRLGTEGEINQSYLKICFNLFLPDKSFWQNLSDLPFVSPKLSF